MRHRASRNLLTLLRLRRLRPRRRAAAGVLARPAVRLACALASALTVLTGAMVAASEFGDDSVPTGDPVAYADRTGPAEPSRSSGRTAWPTFDAPSTPSASSTPEAASASVPERDTGAHRPAAPNDGERRASRDASPLDLPSAQVSATVGPPDVRAPAVPTGESSPSRSGGSSTGGRPSSPTATPSRDHTPPQTTIVSGPSLTGGSGLGESEFVFDANESARFSCSLDGQPFRPCDSPQEYDDLAPGRHEFAVRAIDDAGNVDPTPDRRTWVATGLDY